MSMDNVIGANNDMLWSMPADLRHFYRKTVKHCVIMGRNTQRSITWPLESRINIVISSKPGYAADGFVVVGSLMEAVDRAFRYAKRFNEQIDAAGNCTSEIFLIGGQSVYEQGLAYADRLYLTQIYAEYRGDVFFPDLDATQWVERSCEHYDVDANNVNPYSFFEYSRRSDN